jgi:hypothetical protein
METVLFKIMVIDVEYGVANLLHTGQLHLRRQALEMLMRIANLIIILMIMIIKIYL